MLHRELKDEIKEIILKVFTGWLILLVPALYLGYYLGVNQIIWTPASFIICMCASQVSVKKFFWKETDETSYSSSACYEVFDF